MAPRKGLHRCLRKHVPNEGRVRCPPIGLNVHEIPSALASAAAIRADSSMAVISQVQDNPSGIGNMVSYPWMTSIPNSKGMPRRDCSPPVSAHRVFFYSFQIEQAPFFALILILAAMSPLLACPVVISPVTGRFNWLYLFFHRHLFHQCRWRVHVLRTCAAALRKPAASSRSEQIFSYLSYRSHQFDLNIN